VTEFVLNLCKAVNEEYDIACEHGKSHLDATF
jgi:hypothetical protein